MRIKIEYNGQNPWLYYQYCNHIFYRIKRTIYDISHQESEHYKVRENSILNCSLIKWKSKPSNINLLYYINNCLQLIKINGTYVIRIDPSIRIKNTNTNVDTLIRILEYGTDKIPEYPLIRRVFEKYRYELDELFTDYLKEKVFI